MLPKNNFYFSSLDLDAWINDPPSSSEDEEEQIKKKVDFNETYDELYSPTRERQKELSKEEIEKVCL